MTEPKDCSIPTPNQKAKLPPTVLVMCGWPLGLACIGGAIGGCLGGAAFGINVAIYKSTLPKPVKVVLNVATGVAAFGIWFAIAVAIKSHMK